MIVDEFTGRIMPGRRYSDGLHQAIEAKEHVKVRRESKTLATITFQNLFNKYEKKSGMTGTALTEEKEFRDIYGMDVVEIPTNRPVQRKDLEDAVYKTKQEKYHAVVEAVKEAHATGQPVLVGTITIEVSELLSKMLKKEGIQHKVLMPSIMNWKQKSWQMRDSTEQSRLRPTWPDVVRISSWMMLQERPEVLRSSVQSVMNPDVLTTSCADVPDDREIRENPVSTFLWRMI